MAAGGPNPEADTQIWGDYSVQEMSNQCVSMWCAFSSFAQMGFFSFMTLAIAKLPADLRLAFKGIIILLKFQYLD